MIVPLDAAAAQPPPPAAAARDHQQWRQPEPLDPELEARLRRQRAQQYGRSVRERLAAWHQRFSSKREEQLAAQRAEWEAQRAARLARLADKQQQNQIARAGTPRPATASDCQPAEEGATRGALLHATRQMDAKLGRTAGPNPQRIPAAMQQQRQAGPRRQHQAAPNRTPGGDSGAAGSAKQLSMHATAVPQTAAAEDAPVDPLGGLLAALLAAEGGGDPFSIVNLFVEEQLQLRAGAAAGGTAAARKLQAAVTAQQAGKQPAPASTACPMPPADAAAWQSTGRGSEQHPAAATAGAVERPVSAASDRENVSANVARDLRAGSMLPTRFDAPVGLQSSSLGAAAAAGMAQQHPARQQAPQAATDDMQEAVLPKQDGSKQLYVQQWLQRSAAELVAAELASAPASSSAVTYSEDVDHEEAAEQEALSSSPSSAAHTVQPSPQAAAPAAGATAAASSGAEALLLESPGAAASAAQAPSAAAAAATSASAAPDAAMHPPGSSAVSVVTSGRRPGAPEPPSWSASSVPAGSTPLSASLELALPLTQTGVPQATHGMSAAAVRGDGLPADAQQLQAAAELAAAATAAAAAAEEEEKEEEEWSSSSCSRELPAGLSFGQLEAMEAAGAAGLHRALHLPAAAAAEAGVADEEWVPSAHSSSSSIRGAHSSRPASSGSSSDNAGARQAAAAPQQAVEQQQAQQEQQQQQQGSEAHSSDFDSDVEVSYGEQHGSSSRSSPRPGAPAASQQQWEQQLAAAALLAAEAAPAPAIAAAATLQSPRQEPPLPPSHPQQQRPRSQLHATDDRYPGSPPASAGMHPPATASRPLSPESLAGSRRASGEGAVGSSSSRPGSPAAVLQPQQAVAAADAEPEAVQQEDTVVVCSPSGTSTGEGAGEGLLLLRDADSPYAMLRFGTEPEEDTAAGGIVAELAINSPGSPHASAAAGEAEGAAGSPPGTPVLVSPGEHGSCPGSARVEDGTVVQTEEHIREYLGEVLAYFWAERAEAFAAGEVPPLGLDGYLSIERRREACGDPQHIYNKLLFDATNEALLAHYNTALDSYTGRLAPRLALLGSEQLERNVAQRVLRWAGLGGGAGACAGSGSGEADLLAILAEDAGEDERALRQLADAMQAELAAAAAASSQSGTPTGGMAAGELPAA